MSRHLRALGAITALLLVALAPRPAQAFCGFYVSGADREVYNHATMVVLMREGTTTVLSMQNDYEGPPESFAMVVPVPVILQEENVRTLPREVFERVDRLAAPRLVEYWEQDPCSELGEGTIGLGNLGTIDHGGGGGSGSGYGRGAEVTVEAEFAVGEYDIVILSARDSGALDAWLRAHDYRIPEGAAEVLGPYVASGMKFFVARVDPARVTFEGGRAVLSPLRFHYPSEELSLPVRLGLLSSSGTQDLIVHVLARNQRYEVANYPHTFVPTNLDVAEASRARFGEFYAALFDRTLERFPGAVVTEYAWQATGCDPCPGPVLSEQDLATLGADVAPPTPQTPPDPSGFGFGSGGLRSGGAAVPQVRLGQPRVRGALSPEVVQRVVRRHVNEVRFCYEQQLSLQPDLEGRVLGTITISPTGAAERASIEQSTLGSLAAELCIASALRRWTFPAPEDGHAVHVELPVTLSHPNRAEPDGTVRASRYQSFVLTRLHYRYDRDGLDDDLVFRAVAPVTGGREIRQDGALEQGATPSLVNNFQARYAIRHEWTGAVDCVQPRRGIWGGPPIGAPPSTAAAQNTASAPRGELELASFLMRPLEALGIDVVSPAAAQAPEEPSPTPTPRVSEPATAEAAVESRGCGCRAGGQRGAPAPLALLGLAWVALRRRRRRSPASQGSAPATTSRARRRPSR